MSDHSQNKRIAKNTAILYLRMFLTVGISLYTTRVILDKLGVSDYGLYNVIGGFVSMFYMVTSTLTQAIGRFLTFELGKGDVERLKTTFSNAIIILTALSVFVLILAETIGLWFVTNKLNIDDGRYDAAFWVYQFSILSFIIEMLGIPYVALVTSHERMGIYASVTLLKVILTFIMALLLSVSPCDRLIFYGMLMFIISILSQSICFIYSNKHYAETNLKLKIDRDIFRNIFNFAGWNFLTTMAAMLSSQGINIMLNMGFGTTVNAARGIGAQINGNIGAFSRNFTIAISPQITKNYASGNIERCSMLVCNGAKYSFLLLLLLALPVIFETDYLLSLWLKDVPPYAVAFVRLQVAYSLVDVLVYTNLVLNNATGKIKAYQILISTTQLMIIPLSYIVLKITDSPISTAAVTNVLYTIIVVPRIMLNRKFTGISWGYFFKEVIFKLAIVFFLTSAVCYLVILFMQPSFFRITITAITSTVGIFVFGGIFAMNKNERKQIITTVQNKLHIKKI